MPGNGVEGGGGRLVRRNDSHDAVLFTRPLPDWLTTTSQKRRVYAIHIHISRRRHPQHGNVPYVHHVREFILKDPEIFLGV